MMTTREHALDELLAIEMELRKLTAKRNDLRRIVLMQEYSPQKVPQKRVVAGHTKGVRRGSVTEATLRIIKEHDGAMTANEVAVLLGGTNRNAVSQTLQRLYERGFLHRAATAGKYSRFYTWSLAVHPDQSVNSKEPDHAG